MTNGYGITGHAKGRARARKKAKKKASKPARRAGRVRVIWTAAELRTLRKLAGKQSVRLIARQLKRSTAAVRFKAWQQRIKLAVRK